MKELTDFWLGERDAEKMWASWQDPHRSQVLVALSCLPPFGSVYELGCGSGPNLRRILQARPSVVVGGSEPNEGLAAWANDHFAHIDHMALPALPAGAWDVTFTCYALAYVDEVTVRQVLEDVRSRHLILIEPTAGVIPFKAPGLYTGHAMPCYVHDYLGLARDAGWHVLWRWPIYPHHQGLNTVLTLERV